MNALFEFFAFNIYLIPHDNIYRNCIIDNIRIEIYIQIVY